MNRQLPPKETARAVPIRAAPEPPTFMRGGACYDPTADQSWQGIEAPYSGTLPTEEHRQRLSHQWWHQTTGSAVDPRAAVTSVAQAHTLGGLRVPLYALHRTRLSPVQYRPPADPHAARRYFALLGKAQAAQRAKRDAQAAALLAMARALATEIPPSAACPDERNAEASASSPRQLELFNDHAY